MLRRLYWINVSCSREEGGGRGGSGGSDIGAGGCSALEAAPAMRTIQFSKNCTFFFSFPNHHPQWSPTPAILSFVKVDRAKGNESFTCMMFFVYNSAITPFQKSESNQWLVILLKTYTTKHELLPFFINIFSLIDQVHTSEEVHTMLEHHSQECQPCGEGSCIVFSHHTFFTDRSGGSSD